MINLFKRSRAKKVGNHWPNGRFKEFHLSERLHPGLIKVTLPLAGMCGGGSSGSLGGVTVTLRSVFCLVSFLWALGEELEELLELVTVSPELHATEESF